MIAFKLADDIAVHLEPSGWVWDKSGPGFVLHGLIGTLGHVAVFETENTWRDNDQSSFGPGVPMFDLLSDWLPEE